MRYSETNQHMEAPMPYQIGFQGDESSYETHEEGDDSPRRVCYGSI